MHSVPAVPEDDVHPLCVPVGQEEMRMNKKERGEKRAGGGGKERGGGGGEEGK